MVEEGLQKFGLVPIYYEQPQKFIPYWFEENDFNENRVWVRQRFPACVAICFLYFIFVQIGPRYMRDRKPFNLQRPLAVWNFCLALFSIVCVYRTYDQFVDILSRQNGFHLSSCVNTAANPVASFYAFLFAMSKIVDLVDTVFIVLRKRPLTFLHWFHHLTMVYVSFFVFSEGEPFSAWPAFLNGCVHSIMYTYYGITSLGFKLPRRLAMMVTTTQLLQFITILAVNVYTVAVMATGGECQRTTASIKLFATVISIYFVLFSRLFYYSYIVKSKPKVN